MSRSPASTVNITENNRKRQTASSGAVKIRRDRRRGSLMHKRGGKGADGMRSGRGESIITRGRIDVWLFVCIIGIVIFGIAMIYDASYYSALYQKSVGYESEYYFVKQIEGAVIGLFVMIVASYVNYRFYRRFAVWFVLISWVMLALVFVPGIGRTINGSRRWISLGITLQPIEVFKVAFAYFTASHMAYMRDSSDKLIKATWPVFIVVGVTAVLVIMQPNISSLMYIGVLTLTLLYIGGLDTKKWWLVVGIAAVCVAAFFFLDYFGFLSSSGANYRTGRYTAYIDPFADPLNSGYQVVQSQYAIAAGGLSGTGYGLSVQKLMFLPYRESDYIFAIIAEELGFIGCIAVIGAYMILIWRGLLIMKRCPDIFGSILAGSLTAVIGLQFIFHVLVVTGLLPPTGIPMPFVSAGSSSLIVNMLSAGILLNISKRCA